MPITTGAYSHRNPLVLELPALLATSPASDPQMTRALIYRSNQSLSYDSPTSAATKTTDFRYVGATTVDTQNLEKWKRTQFDDLQTYTVVVKLGGKRDISDTNWYAWYARWDTIGLYLTPTTSNRSLLERDVNRLRNVLSQFLPIQQRVEFFPELPEKDEIYVTKVEVEEAVTDEGVFSEEESYSWGIGDEKATDTIPGWEIFKSNTHHHRTVIILPDNPDDRTVDLPLSTPARTWHSGLAYPPLDDPQ
jgi:hypothetical protein